ncbi:MATE family efflux transporter [Plesiomonas shigelloides]|uniref:MATE family efflux transporter n=1 Tax=Plesiomonas shigelloides TaxID=703 RepID=UPI001261B0C1|nr:MATE family efflux transporter [Plesiomonas shigelloides]KAB7688116.1 MATE family efflux transporter [Plesiomonas shigelloides]
MQRYRLEAKSLLKLAIPVLIAQVAQTSMGFIDTVMAGKVSAADMAAVAVASSIWLPAILFGHGLLMALTPVIAQLNGSGRRDRIGHKVRQGFWLSWIISIPIMLVLYGSRIIVEQMDIDPHLTDLTVRYLQVIMWGVPGYLMFAVLRSFNEGLSKTKPGMVIGFVGLLINIPVNYIFINGKFGAPALGGVGCGVATTIVYWSMFLMMLYYVTRARSYRDLKAFDSWEKPESKTLVKLARLGFPIAMAMFFEVTLFAVVALLISPLGTTMVAGHQIAMNFSAMVFMLPLSMGIAVTIRVGHRLGEKSPDDARVAAITGLVVGFTLAMSTAILTILFRESIANIYNSDPQVIHVAMQLMVFAGIYQCSDSIQVVGSGVLRGYKDTRAIFVITFISYWLIGLPIGYVLGRTNYLVPAMGAHGFWIGFISGLTTAALLFLTRIRWLQRQDKHKILEMASR